MGDSGQDVLILLTLCPYEGTDLLMRLELESLTYVWSKKQNKQTNKQKLLPCPFSRSIKDTVFREDKECHFPHIIPLLCPAFEKPSSNPFEILCL